MRINVLVIILYSPSLYGTEIIIKLIKFENKINKIINKQYFLYNIRISFLRNFYELMVKTKLKKKVLQSVIKFSYKIK